MAQGKKTNKDAYVPHTILLLFSYSSWLTFSYILVPFMNNPPHNERERERGKDRGSPPVVVYMDIIVIIMIIVILTSISGFMYHHTK